MKETNFGLLIIVLILLSSLMMMIFAGEIGVLAARVNLSIIEYVIIFLSFSSLLLLLWFLGLIAGQQSAMCCWSDMPTGSTFILDKILTDVSGERHAIVQRKNLWGFTVVIKSFPEMPSIESGTVIIKDYGGKVTVKET